MAFEANMPWADQRLHFRTLLASLQRKLWQAGLQAPELDTHAVEA